MSSETNLTDNPFSRINGVTVEGLRTADNLTVSISYQVPQDEYEMIWDMVESGFKDLNRKSYEKQDMTKEELEADLSSNRVLKYIARDSNQELIGILTVHVGLEDITWTETDELKSAQDNVDPNVLSYYVGTLVIPVSERGTEAAKSLIRASLLHFSRSNKERNEDALVFFDCAHANYPWLGQLIQSVGKPNEEYPDLRTTVTELYSDVWIEGEVGVHKMRESAGLSVPNSIDKQHYYSVHVDD